MIFDSHTHLNNEGFSDEERARLAVEIEASEVSYIADIGFDLESSVIAARHAEKYAWCYAAVGFHPHDAKDMDETSLKLIKSLAMKPKVKAIGEIGLDFHHNHSPRDVQEECFRKQIRLANELKMPIAIHAREADEEVLKILKEEGAFSNERAGWFPKINGSPDVRVLLHCFSGNRELAVRYVKLGATLSIAGPITYNNAKKSVEVARETPIERLLIETDAPYLTPEPLRGRRNKVPYIVYTAKKVAEIKGLTYEETAKITCDNAKRFYNIEGYGSAD